MLRPRKLSLIALVCLWAGAVAVGFVWLWHYEAAAGVTGAAAARWPAASRLARNDISTLVLFAHPHCPCTGASLSELAKLAARTQGQMEMHVLFIAPDGVDQSWHDSNLVAFARSIPGVTVHFDDGRRETKLFGAKTSGRCLLYDESGRLRFEGGLTFARGHEGDSDGARMVRAVLAGENVESAKTPVFGCPLYEPSAVADVAASISD